MSKEINNNIGNINTRWNELKRIILGTSELHLRASERVKKKLWMTDDILVLMERRRAHKNNLVKCKRLQSIIKKEIRMAKQRWMADKYEKMEDLISRHDLFNIHSKVKEIAEFYNKQTYDTKGTNKIILDEKEIMNAWHMHITKLFENTKESVEIN